MEKEKLLFKHLRAPGDLLMLTIAIRDLHKTYPGKFITAVESCYPEVFYKSPYTVSRKDLGDRFSTIDVEYTEAFDSKHLTGNHFSDGFIHNINNQLNLNIKKTSMFPEIYLTDEEKKECDDFLEREGVKGKFWLINAGIKRDMPLKGYPVFLWKEVIYDLQKQGIQLIQVGDNKHIHPEFFGVKSFVGKTNNLRQYFSLVNKATGCIGAVSLQMHVSAAFRKPCVVIAGGREEANWEQYIGHTYLHTIGLLDCCRYAGCWKTQLTNCRNLMGNEQGIRFQKCMEMIRPSDIVLSVMKYNEIY